MNKLNIFFGTLYLTLFSTTTHTLPTTGDNLGLWSCNVFPDRQMYDYITNNNATYPQLVYHFVVSTTESGNPPLVWDIAGPSNASGTNIHIWGSYTPIHSNQQWTFLPIPSSSAVQIQSVYNTNNCVGVQSPGGIGSPVNIYPCNSSDPLQAFIYDTTTNLLQWNSDTTLCIQGGNNTPSCDLSPFNTYPYCNNTIPIEERLDDLLHRMTNAEKVQSMDSGVPSIPRLGIMSMHSGEGLHGAVTSCLTNPSPNSTGCATSFPCPMALGATFDSDLWNTVGNIIGTESRGLYNQNVGSLWLFAPNINSALNPAWGRNQEVPSEDATVVTSYAQQFISGLQGMNSTSTSDATDATEPTYLLAASTAKHAFVYTLEGYIPRIDPTPRPASGTCDTISGCQRWNYDAFPPSRDLQNYYLTPFQAAVNTGVRSIMCAYNAFYGAPSCGSTLINTELRGVLEWDGHVVSDCTAIELMGDAKYDNCNPPYPPIDCIPDWFPGHNFTFGPLETANAALEAGVDVNCGPFYRMWLEYYLANNNVTQQAIDLAVRRIYRSAIKLGLLDPLENQPYAHFGPEVVDTPAHRAVALQAATESIILLKNSNKLLPIKNYQTTKFAFIGPHANSTQSFLSNYHGDNELVNSHSPLQAGLSMGLNIDYGLGCNICDTVPPGFPNMPCTQAGDTSHIPAAVAAAQAADVAIVFIGSDQTTEAENFDRDNITLAGAQEQLVLAVLAAQPNTVVVFISGGIVSSPAIINTASTVLQVFYPGELGGDAIMNVLLGVNSPSGKLPITMYYPNVTVNRDIRTSDLAADGGITHNFFTGPVLLPFGYGLSYTTFTYEAVWNMKHNSNTMDEASIRKEYATLMQQSTATTMEKSAMDFLPYLDTHGKELVSSTVTKPIELPFYTKVTNTGNYVSDTVLLMFIKRKNNTLTSSSSSIRPHQTLVHFTRLRNLHPNEERYVMFNIPIYDYKLRSAFGEYVENIDITVDNTTVRNVDHGKWIIPSEEYVIEIGDVTNPAQLTLIIKE